ncbi:MAG TPA: oxaloacetate decarboxylase [Acidimicrobiia bacterium]|nr:oxaloacetate decarboxylase [Acidimicrobiia bacterium]
MTSAARLRRLLADDAPVLAPGAANALTARIVADCGFDAVYVSGAGIANWSLGVPDLGLTTMADVLGEVARICDAVDIPVIADADTGYGNPLNVRRTVREFERAGVAAIQLEDQVDPKRCGHFDGKDVIPDAEMVAKVRAAVDARRDPDLLIIARTDARAVEGLDRALERGAAYAEAGADAVFVEAPVDTAELARIGREVPGLLVANMVEGGHTPIVERAELGRLGFDLVIYANLGARAAMHAMHDVLTALRAQGSSIGLEDRIVTMAERNRLTGMADWQALARAYEVDR